MPPVGSSPATDVAFGIVFGLFVLAFLVLAFLAIRWGVRRDQPGRQAWRQRRLGAPADTNGPTPIDSDPQTAHDRPQDL